MTLEKIIIAIDGFSSTGKSTLAKQLARKLKYTYVDTGAMYRAVTLYALQNDWREDKEKLLKQLDEIDMKFRFNEELGYAEVYLNGKNVEDKIRRMEVSQSVSKIASIPEVRSVLVQQQRKIGEGKGVVMDGRDIGSVVFPDAELKIFMTASAKTRAERRYKELIGKDEEVSFEEVLHNIEERDNLDTSRKDSPLVKAEDAVEIDNSHLSLEGQFNKALDLVKAKLK